MKIHWIALLLLPGLTAVAGFTSSARGDAPGHLGLSPAEKSGAGLARDIYIAVRHDGQIGSGIITDPFDGSTAARFDAIFASCADHPDLHFHLGAGTFPTAFGDRYAAISLGEGWTISGSGRTTTIIQLVSDAFSKPGGHEIICVKSPADNEAVEDLTIDGNIGHQLSGSRQISLNGLTINGRASRVRVMNCGTLNNSPLEAFFILGAGNLGGPSYHQLIEDCECIAPTTPMYITFITASGSPDKRNDTARSVIIRGCKVYCTTPDGTFDGHAYTCSNVEDALVEDNYSDGISAGYYIDTYFSSRVTIRGNSFHRATEGVQIANADLYQTMGNPPLANQPQYYNRSLIIEDNYIDLLPQSESNAGIAMGKALNQQVIVRNNTIRATPDMAILPNRMFTGIAVNNGKNFYYDQNTEVRGNCIDIPSPEQMVTCNPYGSDSPEDRRSFLENQNDYEGNYSSNGDFVSGRHHSRFTFYPDASGWYTIFSKQTSNYSSGRIGVFTYPLPLEARGTGTLVAGSAMVDSPAVKPTSQIVVNQTKPGGTPGVVTCATGKDAIVEGKSFQVISTDKGDASSFSWMVLNGGTLAGEFNFSQPVGGRAGRVTQIVAAPDGEPTTVDQVRSYSSTSGGNEVDVHVTRPSKVTIDYDSNNAYYGYYDNLSPTAHLGRAVTATPEGATVTTLTFDGSSAADAK